MSRNTVAEILFLVLLQYFVLLNVYCFGDGTDIAEKRLASQSSTQTHYLASHAVDRDPDSCSRTRHRVKQMWRVDLGIRVWVVSVGIKPGRRLPNVDIRIGDEERVAFESNPLCRQGLEIIHTIFRSYDCAEPMLGKYVYISLNYKEAATLELCDVQVFMNEGSVFDELTYRFLLYSQFVLGYLHSSLGSDRFLLDVSNSGYMHETVVHRKDIIIDLPPKIEMLKRNVAILIPFNRSFEHYRKDTCALSVFFDHYINGTVLGYSEVKRTVSVKSVYYRDNEKKTRERVFHCNIRDVRIRGANICDLQNKCGASVGSHCDKTFISPLLPPGGYHCKCNVGFVPSPSSKLGMDNHVNPGERCIRKPKAIQHSNKNLALTMKVTACSTDNFDGCKKESGCKEVFAFRRFVVDGILKTCFLSLNENKPWLIVHLDDYRPVSYVRVAASPKFPSDRLIVSVGEIKGKLTHFKMCAFRRVLEKGQQLSFGCNDYLFGNAVQITTNSRILSLCEVEVYSYSYANVALQPTSKLKKSFMNDGNLKSCFTKTGTVWSLDLGNNVRVAVVFILHGRSTYLEGSEITVGYSIKKEICTTIPKYEELGNYFECQKPVIGDSLEVELKSRRTFEICEVEVFQTKTVNVAAKRPATASSNSDKAYIGCDQKIDKSFIINDKWDSQWWAVDLMAVCKIHLVRIVTATGYKPADLKDLKVEIGSDGTEVASLDSPTAEPVQTMIVSKDTRTKLVTIRMYVAHRLAFREVEIYNGPLLVVDVCKKPDICGDNYKCVNRKKSHSCICPSGFQIKGRYKKCKDIDECTSKNACRRHGKNSYCNNTAGSYECLCKEGYEAVSDPKGKLQTCRDKDECSNPKLNECSDGTTCVNKMGRYTCKCAVGYEADKGSKDNGIDIKCIDTNECTEDKNFCGLNSVCTNTVGSYHCNCEVGFKSNMNDGKNCSDVDECTDVHACGAHMTCENTFGSHSCTCHQGFRLDKRSKSCTDIDECKEETFNCAELLKCKNLIGAYECGCEDGLVETTDGTCRELPPCSNGQCKRNAICKDFKGTYLCDCKGGYYFSGVGCVELPPCSNGQCMKNAICKDFKGTDLCDCTGGYYFSGEGCVDYNECELNKDICGSNSVCSNTEGSYKCNCEVGYKSANDGGKKCFDINECAKLEICGNTANCENTMGSYTCTCLDGFAFDSRKRICVDHDECTTGQPCNPNMICKNTFGSYTCGCREGYRLDQMHCAEIDECKEETYNCPEFSSCKNQNGSYECLCKGGYRKASDGNCSEICHPECEANSYCQNGKCQQAFLESSGVSFHSRVLFLMIALLCSLVLLWFVVLL